MAAPKPSLAIGFVTAVEHADFGMCGGCLVLNPAGRPLEFHCTAPIKANRAQQILYGPTLRDYLYEQMVPALLNKAKVVPALVCTNLPAIADAVPDLEMPLVIIAAEDATSTTLASFALGKNQVRLPPARVDEQAAIEEHWRELAAGDLDLSEPFVRIREALEEAQRAAATKAAA